MKSTMGSIHQKDRFMQQDASVVRRVRDAGAILIGTTNVPELGFWFECDNVIYGPTKNPYDLSRTSGGSSGGQAAILGAGVSAFGIGSDIGGSIRTPAAFCGIFGHKPSDRIVPITGHFPLYPEIAKEITGAKYPFTVIGPMARTADDLEVLLRLMIGPDEIDLNVKDEFSLRPRVENAEALKVYFLPSPLIHGTSETENDLAQVIRHAARYLKEMGAATEEADAKLLLRGFELWLARTWSIESQDFTQALTQDGFLNFPKELSRLAMGKRKYTLPALLTSFLDKTNKDLSHQSENLQALADLKKFLTEKLGSHGVLLMPVHPRKAPHLGATYTRPFDFAYAGIINALGFPSTAVPMGLSEEGLPLSLQVIAAEDQDHLCLSVARMLEIGFGGWQAPRSELHHRL
jgi:fatty acid amide hydrolase 2